MRAQSGTTRRLYWLPVMVLLLLALGFEYGGLDLRIADLFRDPLGGRWRWGEDWWSNEFLHEGGRALIKTIAVAALLCALASLRVTALRPHGRAAIYLALCIALGAGLTNAAKALSNVDCPWSLQRYGGNRPYVHVFADRPDDLPSSQCFPAGHAAGGYTLLGLYFIARDRQRRRASLYLAPGLLLGLLFGLGQWARGAHFVSHDLWSAATCWLVAVLLRDLAFRGGLRMPVVARFASGVAGSPLAQGDVDAAGGDHAVANPALIAPLAQPFAAVLAAAKVALGLALVSAAVIPGRGQRLGLRSLLSFGGGMLALFALGIH